MATYNIVKDSSGDVLLIDLGSGYTRAIKPTYEPYSSLGRVYMGNGDHVAFSEIAQLNGSGVGLPTNITDMVVRLATQFFTGESGGGGAADLDQLPDGDNRVALSPSQKQYIIDSMSINNPE